MRPLRLVAWVDVRLAAVQKRLTAQLVDAVINPNPARLERVSVLQVNHKLARQVAARNRLHRWLQR